MSELPKPPLPMSSQLGQGAIVVADMAHVPYLHSSAMPARHEPADSVVEVFGDHHWTTWTGPASSPCLRAVMISAAHLGLHAVWRMDDELVIARTLAAQVAEDISARRAHSTARVGYRLAIDLSGAEFAEEELDEVRRLAGFLRDAGDPRWLEPEPLVFSVMPPHIASMRRGDKSVEYRKRPPSSDRGRLVLYESRGKKGTGCQRIVGWTRWTNVLRLTPDQLWDQTDTRGGISRDYFDAYFADRASACALELATPIQWVDSRELPRGMKPPQNYARYKGCFEADIEDMHRDRALALVKAHGVRL